MQHIIKISWLFLVLFCHSNSFAQQAPADPQSESIQITNATIHVGNGEVVENGVIAFSNGKITYVGTSSQSADKTIDAEGGHIFPPLFALNSSIGLVEISAVRSTQDNVEVGSINPHVRSLIAYNTDSKIIPTLRSNGILLAQVKPEGGLVSGKSSVVQLDGWNWEDAAYAADNAIHVNWPSSEPSRWGPQTKEAYSKANKRYQKNLDELASWLQRAKSYDGDRGRVNLRLEALKSVLGSKSKRMVFHCGNAQSVADAIMMADKWDLNAVIVGANGLYENRELLKAHNIPVVITSTQRLPSREDEDYDMPFKLPKLLHDAGVLFAIAHGGNWTQRNLPFQAGQAVGHGLPYEAAVSSVTLNPARVLGIDAKCGSLEVGKDANLILSTGDVLDMRGNHVYRAFIQGRDVDLDDKQKALYRKFGKKYSIPVKE